MMMMPRLQKWGSFFLPRKQKSLSLLSLEHKTPNRARVREELLYSALREWRSLSLTSLFFFERARLREHKFYYTLFCKNTLFFSLLCLLGKMKLSVSVLFRPLFFILSFSSRVLVLALFLHQLRIKSFFQNERTKKSTRHPQHPLLSLRLFSWGKTLFFRFVLPHPHKITFPYSLFFFLWRRTRVTQREFLKVVWNA